MTSCVSSKARRFLTSCKNTAYSLDHKGLETAPALPWNWSRTVSEQELPQICHKPKSDSSGRLRPHSNRRKSLARKADGVFGRDRYRVKAIACATVFYIGDGFVTIDNPAR